MPEKTQQNFLTECFSPITGEINALNERLENEAKSLSPFLAEILSQAILSGGKRLRPAICYLITKALNRGIVSNNHFNIGFSAELIHAATLVHDDIVDESDTRRNIETVWKKWNSKTAVLAGDFILAIALKKLASVKNHSITDIFARTLEEMCKGEINQLEQNGEILSIERYIIKCRQKTALLFEAVAESAAIISYEADNISIKAAREYAQNIGIAFQITDDILNITEYSTTDKPLLIDIRNKTYTAPVIFAIEGSTNIKSIDFEGMNNESIIKFINSTNGISRAKTLAQSYADNAKKALTGFKDSIYKESLIKIAEFSTDREY